VERGLSAASVAAYRSDLEAFGRHLAGAAGTRRGWTAAS
jgi:site-specific recombinase XerD